MRVFVAGATGAIGRRLVPRLIAHGHQVSATTRSPAKVELLRGLGAEALVVDALDATALAEAVARAEPDAIIHQLTAITGSPDLRHFDRWFSGTNTLRTLGTQHLLAAARASGVRRVIAQSYTGWTNRREGSAVKSEDDGFDPSPPKEQTETLAAIRFLEQAVLAAPSDGLVMRYGNFYGPGDSDTLVALVRRRQLPIIGSGDGVWSWIHLDDAADATVAALESGLRGVYNVTDDEPARVAEWLPYLAELVGAKRPLHLPIWAGRLVAGEVATRWMTQARGSSNAKLRAALPWRPNWPSWRQGFRTLLGAANGASSAPRAA